MIHESVLLTFFLFSLGSLGFQTMNKINQQSFESVRIIRELNKKMRTPRPYVHKGIRFFNRPGEAYEFQSPTWLTFPDKKNNFRRKR